MVKIMVPKPYEQMDDLGGTKPLFLETSKWYHVDPRSAISGCHLPQTLNPLGLPATRREGIGCWAISARKFQVGDVFPCKSKTIKIIVPWNC